MLKLLNWWPNLYRENDPDEMSDAWAVSLTDVPYDAAMAGAVALSRTMTWPPAVAEICEAAKPYIGFQPDLMNVLHFVSLLSFLPYSDKIEGGRGKAPGSPLLICGAEWRS